MPPPQPHAVWDCFGQRGYPALIAHAAGNDIADARAALADGADFVEVDIWFRNHDFEARHERRMGPVPLLFEKWYLRFAPASPFTLERLMEGLDGEGGIFLDFKTSQPEAAEQVARILQAVPVDVPVAASSQWWPGLRRLYDRRPGTTVFYSIDVQAKLDLFRSIVRRDPRPAGISCRESLLTPAIVREMHDRGLRVIAWTVDDLARAAELAEWGVDGITTHLVRPAHDLLAHPS